MLTAFRRANLTNWMTMSAVWSLLFIIAFSSSYAQQPSLVRVDTVQTQPLTQTVPIIGRLVSRQTGNVAARIGAPVEVMQVDVGDRVVKGQLIAQLNAEILQADVLLEKSELADAKAELATKEAELNLAKVEFDRQAGLRQSAAYSKARFEDAQKKMRVAEAEVTRAKARVDIRVASLQKAEISLSYSRIIAPYEGIVVERFTENGSYAKLGDPIVKLIGDRALEIEVDVPFSRIVGLSKDRKLTYILDNDKEFTAELRAVLPSENPLTRTRTVRLSPLLDKAGLNLAEGQSVTVFIPAGSKRDVITVHKDAVLKRQGSSLVYVVENDIVQPRTIELGTSVGNRLEVLSGLKENDSVVVRGNERLRPGAQVLIEKDAS